MDYLMLMTVFLGQIAVVFLMNVLRCDVTAPTSSSMNSGRRADIHPMYKQHDPGLTRRHHLSEKQLKRNRSRRRPQKASTGLVVVPNRPRSRSPQGVGFCLPSRNVRAGFWWLSGPGEPSKGTKAGAADAEETLFQSPRRPIERHCPTRLVVQPTATSPSSSGPVSRTFTF